jgi:hypothetical protein
MLERTQKIVPDQIPSGKGTTPVNIQMPSVATIESSVSCTEHVEKMKWKFDHKDTYS